MKNIILLVLHAIIGLQLCAFERSYTLDMSEDFGMDSFAKSEIPLRVSPSVTDKSNHRDLPTDSKYILKFPSSNSLVFDAHIGSVAVAYQNEGEAGRLVLYGNDPKHYLTPEEALTVFEKFHDAFGIEKDDLYQWFETVQQGLGGRGYYQAGARTHYPRITLEAANSFFDDRPVFLNLIVNFDEKSFKRLGVSAETNQVNGLTFDIPAIIKSVRSENAPAVDENTPLEQPEATRITPNPVNKEAEVKIVTEAALVEVVEETPEEPSRWWLWLIGALVVLGGLAVVLRRKS